MAQLQSASRESLARASATLDTQTDSASAADLTRLSGDLFAVLRLVASENALRRALADPAVPGANRSALADRLLQNQVGRQALDVVSELVASRWSKSGDLVEAIEQLARRAVLGVAEKNGSLDNVEDELFRFGRILAREPQLGSLLAEQNTPADKRVELLRGLLTGKAAPVTLTLLEETVRTPRGRRLDRAAEELSELAAARRDRSIAYVRTPVRLSPAQEQRLTESLTRLYGRAIALQVELDPDLLGGLVVRVGGELIDGSISGRLAAARRSLPG